MGRTGAVAPVAHLKPILLSGMTVKTRFVVHLTGLQALEECHAGQLAQESLLQLVPAVAAASAPAKSAHVSPRSRGVGHRQLVQLLAAVLGAAPYCPEQLWLSAVEAAAGALGGGPRGAEASLSDEVNHFVRIWDFVRIWEFGSALGAGVSCGG